MGGTDDADDMDVALATSLEKTWQSYVSICIDISRMSALHDLSKRLCITAIVPLPI